MKHHPEPRKLGGVYNHVDRLAKSSARAGVITQLAAVGLAVESKVLALVRARFLWRFPYMERVQGVLDGCQGDPLG